MKSPRSLCPADEWRAVCERFTYCEWLISAEMSGREENVFKMLHLKPESVQIKKDVQRFKYMGWTLSLLGTSTQSSAAPEAKALQFMKSCRSSKSCMSVQTTVGNNKQAEEWDKKERWRVSGRIMRATNSPLLGKFSLQLGSNMARNFVSNTYDLGLCWAFTPTLSSRWKRKKQCQEESMRGA